MIKVDLALLALFILVGLGVLAGRQYSRRARDRLLKSAGHRAFRRLD